MLTLLHSEQPKLYRVLAVLSAIKLKKICGAFVLQIKTPTMLMLGLDDKRVPPKQGYELYKALKARNIAVR